MQLSAEQIADFRRTILDNYRTYGRTFPWRKTDNPYEILVSEMMLQQTQTLRVVPEYEAWLNRFPTVRSLAEAPLADVLAQWNGLGYNRRAVYLQKACAEVCTQYGGKFPSSAAELEQLPGIGPYTARAVCTFAFNSPEVFVETNIRSVFIFFFFRNTDEKVTDSQIMPLVGQTLVKDNPREWYYALMDYGAELKKYTVNPSRRSARYAKQSKFEGSLRQARGAIIRQLAEKGKLTLEEISAAEHIENERLTEAAEKLAQENLIQVDNGKYFL